MAPFANNSGEAVMKKVLAAVMTVAAMAVAQTVAADNVEGQKLDNGLGTMV